MAEALFGGLLAGGRWQPDQLRVVEISPARREELAGAYPMLEVSSEAAPCEGLVIATKPAGATAALGEAAPRGVGRVLSIAAGVSTRSLEEALGPAGDTAVVRAMPNTPALVRRGATAICAGSAAGEDDLLWAESVLDAVGLTVRVPESQMDVVTGLSGSGPAYVFLMAEALIEAGVRSGLPRGTARTLAVQTLLGASELLASSDSSAEELHAMVTSPGGTTAEALAVLEERGFRAALAAAVEAAARRSAELG